MQTFKPNGTYTASSNVSLTECSTPELVSILERAELLKDAIQKNLYSVEASLDRISPTPQESITPEEGERSVNSLIDKLRYLITDIEVIDSRVQEISFRLNKLV